jgi:hypothetical protein
MKPIQEILIFGAVCVLGIILICYAFLMVLVNPNPLLVGEWVVSDDSYGNIPEPFISDAKYFTFYINDTVKISDIDNCNIQWFTYELIVDFNEGEGWLTFQQGDNNYNFICANIYNMSAIELTALYDPSGSFELVRMP